MAYYAALTSLSQTLHQIPQPHQQITSLHEKVSRLLLMIEDPSQKSRLKINHLDLEGPIRDISYETEDIIESQISRKFLSNSVSRGVSSLFRKMIKSVEHLHQDMNMEFQGLENIMNGFDSILEALSEMKDGEVEHLKQKNSVTADSSRFVVGDRSPVVGLDEDLMQIKDWLTGSPSRLDVISIVGMGGIGKTTLARNLHDDSLIKHYFDIRSWTVVSQKYDVQEMLMDLLDSIRHGGGDLQHKSIEQSGEILYKSLKGWRYLIVMDDVWDTEAWDDIRRFFPDDNNGSRIILTTRLLEVATYANSYSHIHHMSLLSSKASWNLLREKVFGKEECCPLGLEKIGKKIARKCKGLPLAIIVVSGLLTKGSRTQEYWVYIAENVKSTVTGNDDQLMEILSLSYNSLPNHLKPCFLYMGIFPEYYEIFVSQLIKLWIAEGFVKPLSGKSLEEVAEDYLKDLIDRNLIMIHKRNHNGGIKTCLIHDLLRELCVKKAQVEKFLQIMNWDVGVFPHGRNNQRRVSIHSNILHRLTDVRDHSPVHSLLYFCRYYRRKNLAFCSNFQLPSLTMSCRLLRVLDALTIRLSEFPTEILELVHLRYLALIYGGNSFPASISKLRNLQTLIVYRGAFTSSGKIKTLYLPSTIWGMPQLRHLLFQKSFLPNPFSGKNSVVLQNLQTLSGVINFKCTSKVFEMMPHLKKLGISYFYDGYTKWSSYEFDSFMYLRQLETLKCVFIAKHFQAERPLLVNLAFPPNLKRLTLSGCRVSWEKMTVVGSLPNLEVLKLKDHAFEGSVWEPNEGEFSKLKFLLIHKSSLEHWRSKYTHFPRLQHLCLSVCPELVEIPSEIGEIPTLVLLELYECSRSAEASAFLIQEEQQDLENNTLRVRVISHSEYYCSQQNTSLRKGVLGYHGGLTIQ